MDEVIAKLSAIGDGERIQNANYVIGTLFQNLLDLYSRYPEQIQINHETVLLSVLTANDRKLSSINAKILGLCLSQYYQVKKATLWQLISAITEEIKLYSLPSIVVLGIVTRKIGHMFKTKLPALISILLVSTSIELQPHICQCFRRIIKGTGDFLTDSIAEIYNYIFRGSSSANESLRVESIKTIPCMFSSAHISIQKLLPIITPALSSSSQTLRYASAKALAKLLFCTKIKSDPNPFHFGLKLYLKLAQNERNIKTICGSFGIFTKMYDPMLVLEKIKTFVKFALRAASLNISLPSLSAFAYSLLNSVVLSTGPTTGMVICNALIESLSPDDITAGKAAVVLTGLIHFESSQKTMALAGRLIYPLLTTTRKDLRRLTAYFYQILASQDTQMANVFFETFVQFLSDTSSSTIEEFDGFSRAASAIIARADIKVDGIKTVALEWLKNYQKYKNHQIYCGLMILLSINKRNALLEEEIEVIFSFIQEFYNSTTNPADRVIDKFISIFMLVFIDKLSNHKEVYQSYILHVLNNMAIYTASCILCIWKVIKACQFCWEGNQSFANHMVVNSMNSLNKYFTQEVADIILPYPNSIDLLDILYGIKLSRFESKQIDSSINSICSNLIPNIDHTQSIQTLLCREILTDFPTWLAISPPKTHQIIINVLFSNTAKESLLCRLAVVRTLYRRSKTSAILPPDTLPKLLNYETTSDIAVYRYAASCIAKWLKTHPELASPCLEHLEKPTRNTIFLSLIIAEYTPYMTDPIRCFLLLSRLIQTQSLTAPLFALAHMIKQKKIDDRFLPVTINLLEQCCFNDKLRNPAALNIYKKCWQYINSYNPIVIKALLRFPVNSNYAGITGIKLLKRQLDITEYADLLRPFMKSYRPPFVQIASMKYATNLKAAPVLFMLLQQTGVTSIIDNLLVIFDKQPDIKQWTDFCKRIVLNNCVPPAERKGDLRIFPTSLVLIAAMRITVQLVSKMRETVPLVLSCVDDAVSIAFNAIHLNDHMIDYHCYSILTSILRCFDDVRNRDGPLLSFFTSQFNPMLQHALDGTRSLQSVTDFVISYLNFLYENKNVLFEEDTIFVSEKLKSFGYNEDSIIVFCRLAGRINTIYGIKEIFNEFKEALNKLFKMIAIQKIRFKDLGEELSDVVNAYLSMDQTLISHRIVFVLLLQELEVNCSSTILKTLTIAIQKIGIKEDEANFALSIVSKSPLAIDVENGESAPVDEDEDDMDETSFWVVPKKKERSLSKFLIAIASVVPDKQWDQTWRLVFKLAILKPICLPALAHLVKVADNQTLLIVIPMIYSLSLPLFVQILGRISPGIADKLFMNLVEDKVASQELKFEMLRIGFRIFNKYRLECLEQAAQLVCSNLFPAGINFVASLIVDQNTTAIGLNLLHHGIMDSIISSTKDNMRSLPRIIHFISACLTAVHQNCDKSIINSFETQLISVLFIFIKITGLQKEKKPVVAPICQILKQMNPEILKQKWQDEKGKYDIIKALEPPSSKKQTTIELKVFAPIKQRKSANTGWQSLEVSDDE